MTEAQPNTVWLPWKRVELSEGTKQAIQQAQPFKKLPDHIFSNDLYEVWIVEDVAGKEFPKMNWLSIKRLDRLPIHDWRDLQRIKNELVGKEYEAVELYPAESRKVDSSNQYHLWVLAEKGLKFPFGYNARDVLSPEALAAEVGPTSPARQRPFEDKHEPPDA